MSTIKIDGNDYDLETLPETAKAQLLSLQFVEAELVRLESQAAVFKTARIGYINALKQALPPPPLHPLENETIKFG